jgi:hypothetical protein
MGALTAGVSRATLVALMVAIAAGCGNGSGGADEESSADPGSDATETGPTTLPPCAEERHAVAFEIVGALMAVDEEFNEWIVDSIEVPNVRPGAADLTKAYQTKGYEIIYFTLAPSTLPIGDLLVVDALNQWLDTNGFARGPRTRLFAPTPEDRQDESPALSISDELVRERSQGVITDYAYGNSDDKILAFQTGGVAPDHVFSLGEGAGANGSVTIPGDDLAAHRATVEALPKVCE